MATKVTKRIVQESVPPLAPGVQEFDYGLSDAAGALLDPPGPLHDLPDGHGAVTAWTKVRDEVVAEVAPEVARLLNEAVNRRLPWTWEPER